MPNGLPILTYHSLDTTGSVISVAPEAFASHIACLDELGYRAVCLREAVRHRRESGDWPDRTVVLTFDDGYENVYRFGAPVLAELGFSATLFLVTQHVGGTNDWDRPPTRLGVQPIIGWDQASSLARAGWEIGAHTRTHPDLRGLDSSQVEHELRRSRIDIEERVSQSVESFAYPYGHVSKIAEAVATREFESVCLTDLRCATVEPFTALPRVDAYYLTSLGRLRRLVEGRLTSYLALRRLGRLARAALAD